MQIQQVKTGIVPLSAVGYDGFWPGILWYVYEYNHDEKIKLEAERFSAALYPVVDRKADNHDLGFMMYCSLGNGYRLTGNEI